MKKRLVVVLSLFMFFLPQPVLANIFKNKVVERGGFIETFVFKKHKKDCGLFYVFKKDYSTRSILVYDGERYPFAISEGGKIYFDAIEVGEVISLCFEVEDEKL